MAYKITFLPGDGTGPELSRTTMHVLEATGVAFNWDIQDAGVSAIPKHGTVLPDSTIESIRQNKVAIKGPMTTPVGTGFRSVNVAIRKALDLYACLRPCKYYPGVRSKYDKVDIVIVRENTEDLYAGIEFEQGKPATAEVIKDIDRLSGSKIRPDSGISIKPISVFGSERIVRFAFEYAKANNRKKVWAIHKANIQKFSDGLFLDVARRVAKEYPSIPFEDRIVDNQCMQLVTRPEESDVLVLPNLYGDIMSDLCAGLVGGLGVAPGGNVGYNGMAVFEAIHGSAPRYAGQNKVNPTAMILSGMLMLRHIGEQGAANRLEKAVANIIAEGKFVTYDMKPHRDDPTAVGTQEMADAIIKELKRTK